MDQLGLRQSFVNEAYLQKRMISRAIYLFVYLMQNAHGFFQSPSFTRHITMFLTQVSILRHHKGFQFLLVTAYLVKVQRLSNYRMNKLKRQRIKEMIDQRLLWPRGFWFFSQALKNNFVLLNKVVSTNYIFVWKNKIFSLSKINYYLDKTRS